MSYEFADTPLSEEQCKLIDEHRNMMAKHRQNYYNKHKVCPKCRTKDYWTTLVGYMMTEDDIETFRDENSIGCACGWTGITHDLIEE